MIADLTVNLAAQQLPVPVHDADEVRRAAQRILAQRQFQPPPRSFTQRLLSWLFENLARLIDTLSSGDRGSFVAWAVILLGGAVIVLALLRLWRGRGRRSAKPPSALDDQVGRPPHEWLAEADAHAAAGRWRDALRWRYRALVADLAASGYVAEVPGRTTGEYRAEIVGNLPAAADVFGEATSMFERAWYGHADVSPEDDRRFSELMDRTKASA